MEKEIIPFNKLKDLNEPIGSTHLIKQIDYTNREYPFIIYNLNFIKGKMDETHTQMIQSYLEFLLKRKMKNKDYFYRESGIKVIKEELSIESLCFGHVLMDIAFVDSFENCSINDVIDLIICQENIKKVYTIEEKTNMFYATLIKKR